MNSFLKASLCCSLILCCFIQRGQTQAIVSFDTSHYTVHAGHSISVCLNVKNGNFTSEEYEVDIKFIRSSLPHFPDQGFRRVKLTTNTYCFELQATNPLLTAGGSNYTMVVESMNSSILIPGNPQQISVKVLNHFGSTFLGPKELLFIGYDNEIASSGSDKIALLNIAPIPEGTKFLLSNLVPFDDSGYYFEVFNDPALYVYEIEYTEEEPLPPFTKISFDIIRTSGQNPTESIGNFKINGNASTNFVSYNRGPTAVTALQIEKTTNSALSLMSGEIVEASDSTYLLKGNLIDGMTFTPGGNFYNPLLQIKSVNFGLAGSTYGFVICDGDIYLCEFSNGTGDISNWFVSTGNVNDNLNTAVILDTCEINQCPPALVEILPVSASDSMDIVILVDNSRSITAYHFEDMKESIIALIEDMSAIVPNTRFAIVQYCAPNEFDITVPFSYNDPTPIDFDREYVGDSYMGAAILQLLDEVPDGDLTLRDNVQFHTVIFTDSDAFHMLDQGYTPFNDLKSDPPGSTTSMVRYDDWAGDNPVAASTTSVGGGYVGPLDPNPGDPDGTQLPRRYYNLDLFDDPLDDLLADLIQYEYLFGDIDINCENAVYEWLATGGGEIVVNNGQNIETNGEGVYFLNISCDGECMFSDTFSYAENLPFISRPPDGKSIKDIVQPFPDGTNVPK